MKDYWVCAGRTETLYFNYFTDIHPVEDVAKINSVRLASKDKPIILLFYSRVDAEMYNKYRDSDRYWIEEPKENE